MDILIIVAEKIAQRLRKKKRKGCLRENMAIIPKKFEKWYRSWWYSGNGADAGKKQPIEKRGKD
jgi:hypothetical protein